MKETSNISNYLYSDITELIIKAYYKVYNKLGYGFLEKVYEKAMLIELRKLGLSSSNQTPIEIGILLNFGKEPQFKRRVLAKEYKNNHTKS